jgi:hypothetical protein
VGRAFKYRIKWLRWPDQEITEELAAQVWEDPPDLVDQFHPENPALPPPMMGSSRAHSRGAVSPVAHTSVLGHRPHPYFTLFFSIAILPFLCLPKGTLLHSNIPSQSHPYLHCIFNFPCPMSCNSLHCHPPIKVHATSDYPLQSMVRV